MANFKDIFPNLTSDDFIAAAAALGTDNRTAAEKAGGAEKVDTWAQHGSSALIPAYKLPDISYGDTWTFSGDAGGTAGVFDLAGFVTAWNGGADSGTAFPTGMTNDQSNGALALHNGDVVVITDTDAAEATPEPVTLTYLYLGSQSFIGGASSNRGTPTVDVAAGNFHQISSSTSGVSSVAGGNSITVTGSGSVTVNLDDTIFASNGTTSTPKTFTIGRAADTQTVPVAQATAINGTGITLTSSGNGELDITSGGAVDINAAGAASVDGTVATLTGSTSSTVSSGSASISATASGNVAAVSGTNVNVSGITGITGNTTVTGTFTSTSNTHISNAASATTTIGNDTTPGAVTIHGAVTLSDVAASTDNSGNIDSNDTILVVESGVVRSKTLASVGVGAYSTAGSAETATSTAGTAVVNQVYIIPAKTIGAYTLTLPAAGTAGRWIKVLNNANIISATNVYKDAASNAGANLKTAVSLGTGTGQIAGNGTDATFAIDDNTASFELIDDGTNWALIVT